MSTIRAREPGWADVLEDHAAEWITARRLVGQLGACEAAALAFCRLLERWARGEPEPSTAGRRQAALRHAADRVLSECLKNNINEIKLLQEHLHDGVGQLIYDRTRRRPMILPVVVEV